MSRDADNEYFRSLLAAPRQVPERKEKAGPSGGGEGGKKEGGGGGGGKRPSQFKKKDGKGRGAPEGEEDEDKQAYRDRAEERRKGVNPDYEDEALLSMEAASVFTSQGVERMTEEERRRLVIENSKYLGGDERNTHRVKGLDYALLNKVRSQMEHEGEEDTPQQPQKPQAQQQQGKATTQAAPAVQAPLSKDKIAFNTAMGRAVYSAVFEPPRSNVAEMFHPKRTCFVFDMSDENALNPDVPTTLFRAREDCPALQEMMMGAMDNAVLERFSRIMSYLRVSTSSRHGRKLRKQEREHILQGLLRGDMSLEQAQREEEKRVREMEEQERREEEALQRAAQGAGAGPKAGPSVAKMAVDDEDIFGDAGTDYVPTVTQRQAGTGAAVGLPAAKPKFNPTDIYGHLPPVAQHGGEKAQQGQDAGGGLHGIAPPPPPAPPAPPAGQDPQAYYDAYYNPHGYYYDAASGQYTYAGGYDAQQPLGDLYGPPRPQSDAALPPAPHQQSPVDPKLLPKDAKEGGMATVFRQGDPSLWRRRKLTEEERKRLLVEENEEEEKDMFYSETVVDPTEEISDAALLKMRMRGVSNVDYWTGDIGDDDEEDMKQMDGAKPEKSRYDFATEEEYQSYKAKQEANPKAAFQFGQKKGDGRLSQKDLAKKQESKLGTQLTQIKNVMKEKFGEGYDVAFANPDKAAKKEGGGGKGGHPAGGKRELPMGQTPGPERTKRLKL